MQFKLNAGRLFALGFAGVVSISGCGDKTAVEKVADKGSDTPVVAEKVVTQAPVAKIENVVDEHWGVEVEDPYRYMENLDDPYVREWFEDQGAYTESLLAKLGNREAMFERLKELDQGAPFSTYGVLRQTNGDMFYFRREASENLGKLYYQPAGAADPILLVDPETVGDAGDQHYSIEGYTPSWDGKYVVYGLAQGGSEETTYYTMNVATKEVVDAPIGNIETAYNHPQWTENGEGFYYSRRRDLPEDAPATELYKQTAVRYHKLGTDPADDPIIANFGSSERLPIVDTDFPSLWVAPNSLHAVLKVKHGDSNEITLFTAPRASLLSGDVPWVQICGEQDLVSDFAVVGDEIFMLTAQDAPRFKLVKTNLTEPSIQKAVEVLPAGDLVLHGIAAAKDALYLDTMENGVNKVVRVGPGERVTKLVTPRMGAGYISSISPMLDGLFVYEASWIQGGVRYSYNPEDNSFTDTGMIPVGTFDNLDGFVAEEVLVESHDGTKVPVSILYKEGIKLDGTNPTIVYGYGSYGISMTVNFSTIRLAWLEQGGVYAIAHVRGGGEYGQAWHYGGRMQNKPNTWKDLIAATEYMIEKGFTSPEHVAPMGGSAGGILVGRSITERPDLFGAAIIQVGMLDAIRAETTTNGVPNIKEFGTVTEEDGFKGLLEMSAYHHVKEGVKYPATMLAHGYNDNRVEPWMSAKMTARMQAVSESGSPVLLRVDFDSGHGIGSTRDQVLAQYADVYSFLMWQLDKEG